MSEQPTNRASIEALLACPRCEQPLVRADGDLNCKGCSAKYPEIDGVPWLFAEPEAALTEWRLRIDAHLADLARKAELARTGLRDTQITSAVRARLDRFVDAYTKQHQAVATLMASVRPTSLGTPMAAHLALKTRLPPSQGLTTYHANLHRDWCWGDDENRTTLHIVQQALDATPDGAHLVLGAGAARLAYDLAETPEHRDVIALDFNPLLLLAAARLASGASLDHVEFPLAPLDASCIAVDRRLTAPGATSRLHCVLGDGLRAPFRPSTFAAVVTPWFVDVVDEDFPILARRINRLLTTGGRWVIFGSLTFDHAQPQRHYSKPEVLDAIGAAGFDVTHDCEEVMPYLCSPASRHGRRERVVAIAACKRSTVAAPARHIALPEWLVQGNRPVPLLEPFKLQAMTTRIYAFIMSMIDGKRSLKDMAQMMETQKLMPRREAEVAIRGFLIKMFDEATRPPSN